MTAHSLKRAAAARSAAAQAVTALSSIEGTFAQALTLIQKRSGDILLTGVGKSALVGMKTAATLTSLGHRATFLHPVEAAHGDAGIVSAGDVIIAYSYSGETVEVVRLIRHLTRQYQLPVIAITGRGDSSLAAISQAVLTIAVSKEGSPLELAPMASTTAMMVVGDMLAAALTEPTKSTVRRFALHHPGGSIGLSLVSVGEAMAPEGMLPLVGEKDPLRQVLTAISNKRYGLAVVTNHRGALVGVITDGDIRRFLESSDSITNVCAGDLMTRTPKTIRRDASLKEALVLMERYKITAVVVIDARHIPCGIIHIHDIIDRQ